MKEAKHASCLPKLFDSRWLGEKMDHLPHFFNAFLLVWWIDAWANATIHGRIVHTTFIQTIFFSFFLSLSTSLEAYAGGVRVRLRSRSMFQNRDRKEVVRPKVGIKGSNGLRLVSLHGFCEDEGRLF